MCRPAAADASAGDALDDLSPGDFEVKNRVQLAALGLQQLVERLGLRDVARETVEQEAVLGIRLLHAVLRHRDGEFVGDEVAGVHGDLREFSEPGLPADVGPEQIAREDVRDAPSRHRRSAPPRSAGRERPTEERWRRCRRTRLAWSMIAVDSHSTRCSTDSSGASSAAWAGPPLPPADLGSTTITDHLARPHHAPWPTAESRLLAGHPSAMRPARRTVPASRAVPTGMRCAPS
ncbi:hypothetical protein CFP59_07287 [Streptomyces malaysiensis subsp. malaysiensis]|nr:hypothetical protein CFP59_07287 [Streptomyces sp. M56]